MRELLLYIFIMFIGAELLAQVSPDKYCIELVDKNNNVYNIENPEEFLSERALTRRAKQNIAIDYTDLPVSSFYVDSLRKLGLEVLNVSKWFNLVTVYTIDSVLMDTITNLGFVKSIITPPDKTERIVKILKDNTEVNKDFKSEGCYKGNYYNYGESFGQIRLNNGHKLHNEGFRGKNMLIAVTDAGFYGLPDLPAFDSIYLENRILAIRNFVNKSDFVYDISGGTHGMKVFSIIGGNFPGFLIGSAPESDYLLLTSEDVTSETYIEEINWISAAEFADSMGADIINVSLGYVKFDTPEFDHSYSDMDGKTAIISQAAAVAVRKGMIVVVAASNEGNSLTYPWISAPADVDSVLTVGAVDRNGNYASFSSIGPSYDGRVKPDVVAVGEGTINQGLDGNAVSGNGTSYAAPLISGFTACLWQKFPDKTNMEIIKAIRRSSNYYNNATSTLGYGIPDFELASVLIETNSFVKDSDKENKIIFYPNPFKQDLNIVFNDFYDDTVRVFVSDVAGKQIFNTKLRIIGNKLTITELKDLPKGVYIINLIINNKEYSEKIIKE